MKLRLRLSCCVVLVWVAGLKAEDFSKTLTIEEFKAAGLDKLSADELARLDSLVRNERAVEISKVREETTKAKAENGSAKAASTESLLHRMRVVLTPGTDIAYETIETQLIGKYRGFERGTVFTLANGQRWRVIEGSYWSPPRDEDKPRKVKIVPGMLGAFFIEIEGGGRGKVKIVSNGS